jgi:putative ABC transport system permease protein
MRAIGASDGSVFRVFLAEGIIVGLISWLAGSILALPASQQLSDTVGVAFINAPLSYKFSVLGVVLWLAIVVFLAALASFLPARNAVRISVREVLAYE